MKFKKTVSVFLVLCFFLVTVQSAFASGPMVGPIVWNNSAWADEPYGYASVSDGWTEVGFTTNGQYDNSFYGASSSDTVIDVQNVSSISFDYDFYTSCYDDMGDWHTVSLSIYLRNPDGSGDYILDATWDTPSDDADNNDSGRLTVNLDNPIRYERNISGTRLGNITAPTHSLSAPFTGKVYISVSTVSAGFNHTAWSKAGGSISSITFN
ncbi:hypothetical protein SK3146_03299 [Paenibacillus konkukensis]|uniref:Uncharacterized protein n=1 Tax=Paenibacillus konkukensis TaxID=2020716 RepID=A0ABY4RRR2_9BACL|nr:hypothetical protein [Paenibacillus konkukensis]UQZ84067.1 hypothetical protein SK3146_03299 [Paenibacillus konkukensis]